VNTTEECLVGFGCFFTLASLVGSRPNTNHLLPQTFIPVG
jgi:hypothetical protein